MPQERLDLKVLQEQRELLDRLAQLELPELLVQLDLLVQPEQQDQQGLVVIHH